MAYSIITSASEASTNDNSVTTPARNTTGADVIVVHVSDYNVVTDDGVVSDSNGGSWSKKTSYTNGGSTRITTWVCEAPIVGAGHTFTYTKTGSFPSITMVAASGSAASAFDQQNGNSTSVSTTVQPGSVTPSEDNELILTACALGDTGTASVNSGFSILEQESYDPVFNMGIAMAYKIQTSAAAVNPTWTGPNTDNSAEILTLKAEAVATSSVRQSVTRGVARGITRGIA